MSSWWFNQLHNTSIGGETKTQDQTDKSWKSSFFWTDSLKNPLDAPAAEAHQIRGYMGMWSISEEPCLIGLARNVAHKDLDHPMGVEWRSIASVG